MNALGVGSCEVDGWLESRFQEIASAKPTEIAAAAAGPVTLKTTPFGRALIKRTLEKGKRKMTGETVVFDPSLPDPEFIDEKIKIKLKGKRL